MPIDGRALMLGQFLGIDPRAAYQGVSANSRPYGVPDWWPPFLPGGGGPFTIGPILGGGDTYKKNPTYGPTPEHIKKIQSYGTLLGPDFSNALQHMLIAAARHGQLRFSDLVPGSEGSPFGQTVTLEQATVDPSARGAAHGIAGRTFNFGNPATLHDLTGSIEKRGYEQLRKMEVASERRALRKRNR